jgi:hypothetical protein
MLLASFPSNEDDRVCLEGRYANYFQVGHNAYEFILDFGQLYEDHEDRGGIHSRIVTSPAYAKHLLHTLSSAVGHYEADYGTIEEEK